MCKLLPTCAICFLHLVAGNSFFTNAYCKLKNLIFIFLILCSSFVSAQQIVLLTEGTKSSLRGLSVVNNQTVWVSGSNGTVGRTDNGGISWYWFTVEGFEKSEFRDIEAFSNTDAVVMSSGSPAVILRTVNGGEDWHVVFKDTAAAMFLDAMEFWNSQSGIVMGDPIDGRFFIARTFDGGKSWQNIPPALRPVAAAGEAAFAASGTNIRKLTLQEAIFVSGGSQSNLFHRNEKKPLPFFNNESTGANSIAIKNRKHFIVVGGDYLKADETNGNCFITEDGGRHWNPPQIPPSGYRSCVEYINSNTFITCGLNGIDLTIDGGKTWRNVSTNSFHVVRKAKKGTAVFFSGPNGKVAKWKW